MGTSGDLVVDGDHASLRTGKNKLANDANVVVEQRPDCLDESGLGSPRARSGRQYLH